MCADVGDTHHLESGPAPLHVHGDDRHKGQARNWPVVNKEGDTCMGGSLASPPPRTLTTAVRVWRGPQCSTGSEVAMSLGN